MDAEQELLEIADALDRILKRSEHKAIGKPLDDLEQATDEVAKSWSGSWIGRQAYVYYDGLKPPPPGAHFSSEWGLERRYGIQGTIGDWCEWDPDAVQELIRKLARNPNLDAAKKLAAEAAQLFATNKSEVLSILSTALPNGADTFLESLGTEIEKLSVPSQSMLIAQLRPKRLISRDSSSLMQGIYTPPHIMTLTEIVALRAPIVSCAKLGAIARKAGSHLGRKSRQQRRPRTVGTNVFIGHGRSPVWRDLKDFVKDRLQLPYDEFNRVPAAGITNIARLSEMLDAAAIAFVIMTAEDEQSDGSVRARENVVHEAGLFQGRLGFTRAIVLLEQGCSEFSNIQGLGQIRFPTGDIKAVFEDIRRVLEREGIIDA